jgi:hypothetical protein
MTTLAEYNNNPGNIRPAKNVKYEGLLGVDDKGFGIFEKPEYGQKALINDIKYKLEKRGLKTPNDFIDVYTPKGDENAEEARENYKIYIAQMLGLKSTNDPIPDDAVDKLAQAITNFEGGKWQEKKKDDNQVAPAEVSTAADGNQMIKPVPKGMPGEKEPLGVIGGIVGGSLASSVETGKRALPLIQGLYDRATGSDQFMNRPQSRASLQKYLNSQLAEDIRIPLKELEKVSGGNPVRTMSEVQAALSNIQGSPSERVAKKTSVNPSTGQPRKIYTTTPGKAPVDLSAYQHTPTIATRIADKAAQGSDIVKSALPSVGRVGFGALGGANAAVSGYEAWELAQKLKEMKDPRWTDYARLASKTMATAGGALSMVPLGWSQVIGAGLQAPEAAISLGEQAYGGLKALNERRKNAPQEDTDRIYLNNPMP